MKTTEFSAILAVIYIALFSFGLAYNMLIAWLSRKRYLEGLTALSVAFGTAVTLAPFAAFDAVSIWWVYGAFAASGAPMIAGALWRYVKAREEAQRYERQTKTLA